MHKCLMIDCISTTLFFFVISLLFVWWRFLYFALENFQNVGPRRMSFHTLKYLLIAQLNFVIVTWLFDWVTRKRNLRKSNFIVKYDMHEVKPFRKAHFVSRSIGNFFETIDSNAKQFFFSHNHQFKKVFFFPFIMR